MKLVVGGKDYSEDVGRDLLQSVPATAPPDLQRRLDDASEVLALRAARSLDEYQDIHVALMRARSRLDTSLFDVPAPSGLAGRIRRTVQRAWWRELRPHYDWLTLRQNSVNQQLAYEMDFAHELGQRHRDALDRRLTRLEAAMDTEAQAQASDVSDEKQPADPTPSPSDGNGAGAPRRVDQLLAGYADGDAISQEAREIRTAFRTAGSASDIFVPSDRIGRAVTGDCLPLESYDPKPGDVTLHHYSIDSPATEHFLRSPARRIVRYHNITPAHFFEGFDDDVARQLERARGRLHAVASAARLVLADSAYNADEIRSLGLPNVEVVPLLFSVEDIVTPADPATAARFGGDFTNILFVGRIAPNKSLEDLLPALAWIQATRAPRTRLVLVGSEESCPRYIAMLRLLVGRLELPNVIFTGFISNEARAACYAAADVFVSTSRHEGYCLPLIEAMLHGVPVVARSTGGTPEALGGGGVLYDDLTAPAMAELLHRLTHDGGLRREVLASQARRIEALRARDNQAECQRWIERL